jgi:D-alanyl-D-alanine carboxypeptidase/D-alanyl-D-alanine-endopeptidase (penicillin-binding protein 4)
MPDDEYSIDELVEFRTPISRCLRRANKISLGLSAEALFKTIAAEKNGGENGSWEKGKKLVCDYLLSLGMDKDEFNLDDGSGLSRKNRLSPSTLTKVLGDMYQSPGKETFYSSLAISGEDGTIARYFRDFDYKGKIRGKTGYISGVKSFAGIAQTPDGDYFFAILVNQANGATREAINDIAKAIIDY